VERPTPEEYQPRLRPWSHIWRLLLMLALSAVVWGTSASAQADAAQWWWVLDVVLGAATYVLVFFRRRRPLTVAVVISLVGAVSGIAAGPATLAAVSLATRRRWREIALVGSLNFAAAQLYGTMTASGGDPFWLLLVVNGIATVAMLGWGMYIGSRRELIWTLRNRAERAEAEQELRDAQARGNERARIAREMHDVLAHRISQISMHAGALAYREDLGPEETRASAAVIRDQAHEALTDLRDVLGVLRDDSGEQRSAPQPTYADLPCLVAEAHEAGMRVDMLDLVTATVPDGAGRTIYRIVQEGMTNAHKHAPGALLTVRISGSPDAGLDLLLTNPLGFGPTQTPGSGLGLVGLAERAELRGGRLASGREGPQFVLRGWIPWGT
jgi:signal transduction histidine kinase